MGNALMVTGHREITHRDLVADRLADVLARGDVDRAISGGAEGADTLYAAAAIAAGIELELYLPNRHYLRRYPAAVPAEILTAAAAVHHVVDRPDIDDWRTRWDTDKWWRDNFARNAAMVAASTGTVVVTPTHPRELAAQRRGGTAAALRDVRRARPDTRIIWVPDRPDIVTSWVRL
jgi:hypothetical protein